MRTLVAAGIGIVSGVASGAFGIGGALLTTPGIRVFLGVPALIAVGTPLPVIIPTALSGLIAYVKAGLVDRRLFLAAAPAGIVASVGGALLTSVVPGEALLVVTAAVILVLAWRMLPGRHIESVEVTRPGVPAGIAVGAASGFASGLLGVGGGFVLVPLFTAVLHVPLKAALGTSLAIVAVQAVPGTIVHAALGHVDWVVAAGLAAGVIPGGIVGSRLAVKARDATLRMVVALALGVIALAFGVTEILALRS